MVYWRRNSRSCNNGSMRGKQEGSVIQVSKYCRYCGHLFEAGFGGYYCQEKKKFLTENTVRSYSCQEFGDCGIDIITGKDVKESRLTRKTYTKKANDGEQIGMIGGVGCEP